MPDARRGRGPRSKPNPSDPSAVRPGPGLSRDPRAAPCRRSRPMPDALWGRRLRSEPNPSDRSAAGPGPGPSRCTTAAPCRPGHPMPAAHQGRRPRSKPSPSDPSAARPGRVPSRGPTAAPCRRSRPMPVARQGRRSRSRLPPCDPSAARPGPGLTRGPTAALCRPGRPMPAARLGRRLRSEPLWSDPSAARPGRVPSRLPTAAPCRPRRPMPVARRGRRPRSIPNPSDAEKHAKTIALQRHAVAEKPRRCRRRGDQRVSGRVRHPAPERLQHKGIPAGNLVDPGPPWPFLRKPWPSCISRPQPPCWHGFVIKQPTQPRSMTESAAQEKRRNIAWHVWPRVSQILPGAPPLLPLFSRPVPWRQPRRPQLWPAQLQSVPPQPEPQPLP